jgi:hypothetical protein
MHRAPLFSISYSVKRAWQDLHCFSVNTKFTIISPLIDVRWFIFIITDALYGFVLKFREFFQLTFYSIRR